MYSWYKNAQKCYVYLYDVPSKPWAESDWFSRGWTLQVIATTSEGVRYGLICIGADRTIEPRFL